MYNNTTLGDLIDFLETQHKGKGIRFGFSDPHSDRGSYEELAFCEKENTTIGEMLEAAEMANGATYEGWKGGEYTMDRSTPVYIGEYGCCGDAITPFHFKTWEEE